MLRLIVYSLLLLLSLTVQTKSSQQSELSEFHVGYQWNFIDYAWKSDLDKNYYRRFAKYIPNNIVITGIASHKQQLFVTLPRLKHGVPATLATIPAPNGTTQNNILLKPFPSWEMNRLHDCEALQNVQSCQLDLNGVLWVIDGGRTATFESRPTTICPPKLILFDLNDNHKIVRKYIFPDSIASHKNNILNDLVIDGNFAYITDTSSSHPGLIVYSFTENFAWKFRDNASMEFDPDAVYITINNTTVHNPTNIDSLALVPHNPPYVLYAPLSSFFLYNISTTILQNSGLADSAEISDFVTVAGRKKSQSDGLISDEYGKLYFGLLGLSEIDVWDTRDVGKQLADAPVLYQNLETLQWPDSFAIDTKGNLFVTTNRLQNFLSNKVELSEINYRILFKNIRARSYLYGLDQTQIL